ncbi:5'-3' exoribonuclease [Aphelenchoides avenae]|nr:5'-3' exoribonuclease [Aphelenchus avenae]
MGVPGFFRWLSRRYPRIITKAIEEKPDGPRGVKIPVDACRPNPNFQEFDNLYIDMNSVVHNCASPSKSEDEIFVSVFEYIDRVFSIVRPRRLLYMAIDGVAPRAKMNQQRIRRFLAIKENTKARLVDATASRFEKNCITPGTPFMAHLADGLRFYVHKRISTDPAWKNIQVILSDANVPGEGEHKIMDFIRRQRASSTHDPNTAHCLCGADADLIMLGLASHEANFTILREELPPLNPKVRKRFRNGYLRNPADPRAWTAQSQTARSLRRSDGFVFVRLPVLREYLKKELAVSDQSFAYDFERAIDDWVFLWFFVGNDFLPPLPSMKIKQGRLGAMDRMVNLHKGVVRQYKGWLTENGELNSQLVAIFLVAFGTVEDERHATNRAREQDFRRRNKPKGLLTRDPRRAVAGRNRKRRRRTVTTDNDNEAVVRSLPGPVGARPMNDKNNNKLTEGNDESSQSDTGSTRSSTKTVIPTDAPNHEIIESGSSGEEEAPSAQGARRAAWKERYYNEKFATSDSRRVQEIVAHYATSLCWTLKYYYQACAGCPSWSWYYPYHHAPFPSDCGGLSRFRPNFTSGTRPFRPLEQLMCVLPSHNLRNIPVGWRHLMTDPSSEIIDFYPSHEQLATMGKRRAHGQPTVLLPFVDETRLLNALSKVYHKLTPEEKSRNLIGDDRLFAGQHHALFAFMRNLYEAGKLEDLKSLRDGNAAKRWAPIDPMRANGMTGDVRYDECAVAPGEPYPSPIRRSNEYSSLKMNVCLMSAYRDPQFPKDFVFKAVRLVGARDPPRVLSPLSRLPQGRASAIVSTLDVWC